MPKIVLMPVGYGKTTLAQTNALYRDVDDAWALLSDQDARELRNQLTVAALTGDYGVAGPKFDALVAAWAKAQPSDSVLLVHGLSQARAIVSAGVPATIFKYDLPFDLWLCRFHAIRAVNPERARHMVRGLNDHMRPEVRSLPTYELSRQSG